MQAEARWPKDSLKNILQKDIKPLVQEPNLFQKSILLQLKSMNEVGIDITNQKSKEINRRDDTHSDKIINMGCMEKEACPSLFLNNLLDWNIEDPKGKPIEKVRDIRDEIHRKVKELVAGIKIHQ